MELYKNKLYFIYILFLIFLCFVMNKAGLQLSIVDDKYFSTIPQTYNSIYDFAVYYYHEGNGRYLVNFIMPYVIQFNIWVWRILNIAALMLFFIFSGKIVYLFYNKYHKVIFSLFIISVLVFANWSIFRWSAIWVPGSFNYLYPPVCLLIILYFAFRTLIKNYSIKIYELILLLPFCIYLGNSEQACLIGICLLILVIGFYYVSYKKINIPLIVILILLLCSFYITLSSPATEVRYMLEIDKWYPVFKDLSLLQKSFYGYAYTVCYNLYYNNYLLIILLNIMITVIYYIRKNSKLFYLSLIPFCYILLFVILRGINKSFTENSVLYNFMAVAENIVKYQDIPYISVFIASFIILLTLFLTVSIFNSNILRFFVLMFFAASIMSAFILSFSPTIYASGVRIFFIPNVMMSLTAGFIFAELIKNIDYTQKKYSIIYTIFIIVCLSNLIGYIFK